MTDLRSYLSQWFFTHWLRLRDGSPPLQANKTTSRRQADVGCPHKERAIL